MAKRWPGSPGPVPLLAGTGSAETKASDQLSQALITGPASRPLLFEILTSASAEMFTLHPSGCIIDEQS
jgi:hypothetical protein